MRPIETQKLFSAFANPKTPHGDLLRFGEAAVRKVAAPNLWRFASGLCGEARAVVEDEFDAAERPKSA